MVSRQIAVSATGKLRDVPDAVAQEIHALGGSRGNLTYRDLGPVDRQLEATF